MKLLVASLYHAWTDEFRAEVLAALPVALDRFPDTFTLVGDRLHWTDGTSGPRVNEALSNHSEALGNHVYSRRAHSPAAMLLAAESVAERVKLDPLPVLVDENGHARIDMSHPLARRQLSDPWLREPLCSAYWYQVETMATVLNAYTDEQLTLL